MYLSAACVPAHQWDHLDLLDLLTANKKVLYIGVGAGSPIKDLFERGMVITALDISTIAEETVKGYITDFFLSSKRLPKNEYDLVVSYLVAQHMTDADLSEQIKNVLVSMTAESVFAMQFFMLEEGQTSLLPELKNDDLIAERSGHVGRTLKGMQKLIEDAGGRIIKWGQTISFNELPGQPKWQIVHFGK